ncbi:phosphoenolpyruvate--protein phosphotransferase [Hahella sp. KA22]|uniref:phosphoenolpyruvate--protein phosphotransferase n=1 Tax=unclassified Hahella TaxID=2624107 RepID=UPI000FDED767|nr:MULTISPECIES: phosphoenolpyruvate--protein phosphotransferase [unclassified Hahella]AZZ94410.1 phosphoenolpyruvate--protein phosphotransferase [Hahella sp. KA22]MBU6953927.1 phosphoenolpyruvate--protein phosphotransferase [Hahella sp. HN01]QAY57784.1 phosphoenolpyruvate--protein phosphotransferase [Hahella sp. KA22]
MLSVLRSIVQEVNAAPNLGEALELIVKRVHESMDTEVCSIYLLDPETNHYILMATQGLNPESIGKVKLGHSEGLVGLVGVREEPLNLHNAPAHPRYRYFPETGEEKYKSFLGVPIIHHRKVLGVLVVQQQASRLFDESEEAFLVTISAQLAAVIAHGEATGIISGLNFTGQKARDICFKGVAGASGVAIGKCVVKFPHADLKAVPEKPCTDIEAEMSLFDAAVAAVRQDIKEVGERLSTQLRPEEQALFDVYLGMLDDNALSGEVKNFIREGNWAQGSLKVVVQEYVRHFEAINDAYLRERAVDIKDLGQRVLAYLQKQHIDEQRDYPENTILVSEELTPSMLGEVPREKLLGLVSVQGSGNSHVAILARAMGLPCVMGVIDMPINKLDDRDIIIDGYNGEIYSHPSPELLSYYNSIVEEEQQISKGLEELRDLPCVTKDGHHMTLWVNTGLMTDVVRSLNHGAEGVGLYRTEVPFMINDRFPSEQEQRDCYREQLEAFAPSMVTMRTLDVGGDKALSYFPISEENPFLGWRGIRVTLDHPEIFLVQVRAMLKASEGLDNLRIMLPMISNISEIEEALHLIYRVYHEVREEGANVRMPPVGVMIEVPSAIFQVKEIAERVDFISVGSNDLTQYMLAVDRNNPRVASLYHSFHPSVLQALYKIACDAHAVGKQASICGELAGDPGGAILLTAMGYDVLSMNAVNLPKVKSVLRSISLRWAEDLLRRLLIMDSPQVIKSTLEFALKEVGFEHLTRPVRQN